MQPVNLEKYRDLYLQTVQQYLQSFSSNLNAFATNQTVQNAIEEMFISIHSIKSQSLVMGYTELGNFCKDVEQQLREIKDGKRQFSLELLHYFQQAQQKITAELEIIKSTGKDMGKTDFTSTTPTPINGKRILLVEDDAFFENFYSRKLKEAGFMVDIAVNGADGLLKMTQNKPDLILLDIIMPIKDGFEVLKEKSRNLDLKAIPLIVFSTLGQEEDIQRAKDLGANDYVNKSFFDFENLLSKIKTYL